MHPLNDHAWQSDTRMFFFLFMDSQGTVNGTFYDGQVFFQAKLQLVADPLTLCTFFPHKFRVEVPFHRQTTYFYQLNHHRQAGQRTPRFRCSQDTGCHSIMSASARENCFAFRAALTSAPNVSKPGQSSIFAILHHPYTFFSSFCVAIISAAIYNEAGPFFAREKARFPF